MNSNAKRKILTITLIFILASCSSSPTQTIRPDFTATSTPTFTPIISFTDTPSPTNTPEIKTYISEDHSPDGTWNAVITVTIQGTSINLLFKVSNNLNNQSWVIENTDFTKPENPLDGYKYPYIFKWSDDGKHMYYSHLSTGGDGCFVLSKPGGFDLQRLDLASGEINIISQKFGRWMTLSPDEKKLAYIDGWGGGVVILDIETGKEKSYPLPLINNDNSIVTDTHSIVWSLNGKTLVYAYFVGVCDFLNLHSYVILLYPDTNRQEILIESNEQSYFPIEWNIQERIILEDNENKLWWLNPKTKEITPAQ